MPHDVLPVVAILASSPSVLARILSSHHAIVNGKDNDPNVSGVLLLKSGLKSVNDILFSWLSQV